MSQTQRIGKTWRDSVPEPDAPKPGQRRRPNVLIVMLDDVGFSDLGCYGSEIPTPTFDRLAAGGLKYRNFHVTAMCSPTRACLLTGCNAHRVGMGIISEWSVGFPGYRGFIDENATTMAEVLRAADYATWIVGKWHLTPKGDISASGPFKHWPLGRGFERWYGFHTSFADHWHPDLTEDNRFIDAPNRSDYFLTTDLVDNAVRLLRDHASTASNRPFFLYVAPGACHWPHHAPAHALASFHGRYDQGWQIVRQQRLARQIQLGVVPEETELPPMNPDVVSWDNLSPVQRRFAARLQEAYAAFLHHTDAELGRIIAALEEIGELDDTLIICLSDNGASPEGGAVGTLDNRKHRLYATEDDDERMRGMERIGSEQAFNHYPLGWAQASNTPLKWYKKDTHGGGVRSPLIVHWPAGLENQTGWRSQFHHVVDLLPTVLAAARLHEVDDLTGPDGLPIDGVSMTYSFDQPDAYSTRDTQYFELFGDRAIYKDGWKAVTHHEAGSDFDTDRWELYRLDEDFSECRNLAADHPERLNELEALWWSEAKRNHVLPLDDREAERIVSMTAPPPDKPFRVFQGASPISRMVLPDLSGPWKFSANLVVGSETVSGVILAMGSAFAGFTLFADESGRLCFDYRFSFDIAYELTAQKPLLPGTQAIALALDCDDGRTFATLCVEDRKVGTLAIPRCWPGVALIGALHCGRDPGSAVSLRYSAPNPFCGGIENAMIDFQRDPRISVPMAYRAVMDEH